MKKNVFSLIATGVFLFSNGAMAADVVSSTSINNTNLSWRITEQGELIVSGTGNIPDYSDVADGSERSSNAPWSAYRKQVTKVTIEQGVTKIGQSAFRGFSQLTEVNISEGVTDVKKHAFEDAKALTSISFPTTIKTIGEGAFSRAENLKNIDFGGATGTKLGNKSFAYNYALQTLTIPDTVTEIGGNTFVNATGLQKLVIGDGVTKIGSKAFSIDNQYNDTNPYKAYESQLKDVTFGKNITSIGSDSFKGAPLETITIDSEGTAANYAAILTFLQGRTENLTLNCLGGDTCASKMAAAISNSDACKNDSSSSTCTALQSKITGMLDRGTSVPRASDVTPEETPETPQASQTGTGGEGMDVSQTGNSLERSDRRIYTVMQASRVAHDGENTVKIRYR